MTTTSLDPAPQVRSRVFSTPNLVLLLVCLMYGLTYIDRINVNTAGPVFQRDLHLNTAQLGWVFSAFGWAYLALQVSGGWLSDRFGARLTLTVCGVIWAGATVMTGLVGSFAALIAARLILGLGEGATFPTATRALSDWASTGSRGYVQGITHSFARFGNAITPPLVAWLIRETSWRGSFVILGGISLAWALVWWLYFRDDPARHWGTTAEEKKTLSSYAARMAKKKEPVPWRRLSLRMAPVTVVYFCYGWTLWLYLTWLPSFFLHNYKLDLKHAAISASSVYIFGAVGNTLGGLASDYVLRKTGDRNKARRNIVVACFLLSLAFMLPVLMSRFPGPDATLRSAKPGELCGHLPGCSILLRRIHHRSDVGDSHGHRPALLRLSQRPDERGISPGRRCFPADRRIRHPDHQQLGPAFSRQYRPALVGSNPGLLDEAQ